MKRTNSYEDVGVLPVINVPNASLAVKIAEALRAGGLNSIEVTLRSPDSLESIKNIKSAFPDMTVGAGTVLRMDDVNQAIKSGADFVVSPGYDEEIVDYCVENGVSIVPGCSSASEIQRAVKKGISVVKFFPAELSGGVEAIKLLSGPFPNIRFIPTGGINFDNLGKYLANEKILACGGSFMATKDMIERGDFEAIVSACQKAVSISRGSEQKETKIRSKEAEREMKTVVGFGDYIVRLNPQGYFKFIQANSFDVFYTGAEANVLSSLSYMGMHTQFVTRLPDNMISECAVATLKKFSVGTEHIAYGGERIGLFYLEKGASQRPSKIVYDRKYSSFCSSSAEDYDWEKILRDAGHFHFTGITPALGDKLPEICLEACKTAKRLGVLVSCDLNYRKNLWTRAEAKAAMEKLLPYVDLLIANEEDAADVLDIHASNTDVITGRLSREGYVEVAEKIAERYGVETVAITLRKSISASDNDWSALLYKNGKAYFSKEYRIHIVDRVGGGDSFGAGLIYAIHNGFDEQKTIEFAAAASCLKQTIELDVNLSKPKDILALVEGDGSGRVQR